MLTVIDEYTRECLAILVARQLKNDDVLYLLARLFVERGVPDHSLKPAALRSSIARVS